MDKLKNFKINMGKLFKNKLFYTITSEIQPININNNILI